MAKHPVVPPPVNQTVSVEVMPRDWQRFHVIAFLARELGWREGAELGVMDGHCMAAILAECPALRMFGVDLWEPQPANDGPEDWCDWPHADHYRAACKAVAPFTGRAELWQGLTAEAAGLHADGTLDFVWIDADHSTEGVTADIRAWLPKLKPTGWFIGHDISWPTVKAAVDALLPGYMIGPDVTWFRPIHPQPGWWASRFG